MNPKDMTNSELIVEMVNRTKDYGFLNDPKPVVTELLRRLDEADALRNENEELRKDKGRMDFLSNPDRRVSQSRYRNGVAYEVIGCFGECLRVVIDTEMRHDAAKAREFEASHE